jgi:enediyne polyketide synthase
MPGHPSATEDDDTGIDPAADLYGGILFHQGRFRRIHRYEHLAALSCRARVTPSTDHSWFSRYLPERLLLGDPGCRDAAIHAIQACIPHARLIPVGAGRIECALLPIGAAFQVAATERRRDGDLFTYDVEIREAGGAVLERWHGLRLRKVEAIAPSDGWTPALLAPYVERRLADLLPQGEIRVAFDRNGTLDVGAPQDREQRTGRAIQMALGRRAVLLRRPDGKVHTDTDAEVSAAHASDLTLAVASRHRIGCDLETVAPRTDVVWTDLLGAPRFALARTIAGQVEEELATAATRVWGVMECLKKAGAPADTPLTLEACHEDGWVTIRAGARRAATYAAPLRGAARRVVLAVTTGI